jgi:hypothetical protein
MADCVFQLTARVGKLTDPFFSGGSYIAAAPTSQSNDCLVEIAFLAADSGERDHRSTLTAIDFASWRADLFRYRFC